METNFKHCLRDCFSLLVSQFLKALSPDKQIPTVCSRHSRSKKKKHQEFQFIKFTHSLKTTAGKQAVCFPLQLVIQTFVHFTNFSSISSFMYARKKEIPDYFFKASLFHSIAVAHFGVPVTKQTPSKAD